MVHAHGYTHFKLVEQSRYHQVVSRKEMRGNMGYYHKKSIVKIQSNSYTE